MAKSKPKAKIPKAKVVKGAKKKRSVSSAKKVINKAADKRAVSTKKEIELALDGRKKLSLQKRAGDTIVYVRMKPDMWNVFEQAYADHCIDNMLNPASYGMSTFVRERAFAQLKASGTV
jgi:hypothetical protein